jgi:hypothetical protein
MSSAASSVATFRHLTGFVVLSRQQGDGARVF